jgi:pyruvate,water dikinase
MTETIALTEAANWPVSEVGGKAHALGRLIGFGAPVPPGFVVRPGAELAPEPILTAFNALGAEFVAVRSSAAGEDSLGQSWAGQFESYLYVPRAQLLSRIADCRASGRSARAAAYDSSRHVMPVAVVVQAMVPADVAGVMFTANPVTLDRTQLMVEAVYGLGEQLVQGLATPDHFVLDRTGRIIEQIIPPKPTKLAGSASGLREEPVPANLQRQPALTAVQLSELTARATGLESRFGHPLDIEFAYAKTKLFIVQARPITTL